MFSKDDVRRILGGDAVGNDGAKIGTIGQVYLDDQSGEPEWVTVNTGLFGTKESFVPLTAATVEGNGVRLPFDKSMVKGAPSVSAEDGHLSPQEETELYEYYGMAYSRGDAVDDVDVTTRDRNAVGYDTSGPTTDDAMTRSEEKVRAGTEKVQTGKARLRKWVETEDVNITVPVTKEKARLETEPITDANRGDALSGPDLSEEEHEVTLTEERPVVAKETVPVERVRLTTETEHSEETVSTQARKERIAADGDVIDVAGQSERDRSR